MKVKLRRDWFVEGVRFRRDPAGTAVPDYLKDQLPSTAVIMEKEVEHEEPPEPKTAAPKPLAKSKPLKEDED